MNFYWEKKGHIYKPDGSVEWMKSHTQGPAGIVWDNKFRTFFASRPSKNLTLPTFIDLDVNDLSKVLYVNPTPILELGTPGTFDEHGIIPHPPVLINGLMYLYYIGWSRRANTPYSLSIGLSISDDGAHFRKYCDGPILSVDKFDALSVTAPTIFERNGLYYMFYTAGLKWIMLNGRWEHTYTVRLATSKDGINWDRDFKNILQPHDEFECLSAPTVIELEGEFHMWYSRKGSLNFRGGDDSYRIGYATSKDLFHWERKDHLAGIDVSPVPGDWDSEMVEYTTAFELNKKYYLFYNGNGFSESGFGYAELVINK